MLDRPSQLALDSAGISRGIFAPAIRYHAGTFYMITTIADRGGNFIVTAKNPAGPWSGSHLAAGAQRFDGIDPSFFFDDDGKAYVVNNGPPIGTPLYDGHRAIWIQEFDVATKKMVGPRSMIVNGGVDLSKKPIWIEAPHIFKRNGMYYLICAEGGTADQHSEVVFRSDSPRGPYMPGPVNPILTQRHLDPNRAFPITSTGHADFVETQNGDWWAVFLGTRPYGDNLYNTGRETFLLPVHWVRRLAGDSHRQRDRAVRACAARTPRAAAAGRSADGQLHRARRVHIAPLAPYWNVVRTPRDSFYDSHVGARLADARGTAGETRHAHATVVRRAEATAHQRVSVDRRALRARPRPGDVAGLVAFQNR